MPDLPTITVSQAQQDWILAAFGGNPVTAVPAYKKWLSNTIREAVLEYTTQTQLTICNNAVATATAAADTLFPKV